ncbi:MAG: polysaccharide pyruvyl transferase family protein [Geobacter sp.]|nr:MAG: polysaccharide pyruvyl transferase family protein [Geobacter sp.]
MNILVDHGDYNFRNIGDSTMLYVALSRLTNLFPDALFYVVSSNEQALKELWPAAIHLPVDVKRESLNFSDLVDRPWKRSRKILKRNLRILVVWRKDNPGKFFAELVASADLVVAAGGGYINDEFCGYACSVLRLLAYAHKFGCATVMVGQGLGPVTKPVLLREMTTTLPNVDLFCLREEENGSALLRSMKVSPEKIIVTGDDALVTGCRYFHDSLGEFCGVNLRNANYANSSQHFSLVCAVISAFAENKAVPLEPLPVSRHVGEDDALTLATCFGKYLTDPSGGDSIKSSAQLCRSVGNCRIVVTGSYHAAVFALAQGIPVVALVGSSYYSSKFTGLANLFPSGVEIIHLSAGGLAEKLLASMDKLWESADELRPALRQSAERQRAVGLLAYERIRDLVQQRN